MEGRSREVRRVAHALGFPGIEGVENARSAFPRLLGGEKIGKMLVEVDPDA